MLKVIIADDEQKICQLLLILVDWEALGFKVVAVEQDGTGVLEKAKELKPDVIITDIRMPGCSGLELLQKIRQEDQNVEFLIMSGYRDFDYARTALRDGAADYLLKPLDRSGVENALKKIKLRRDSEIEKMEKVENIKRSLSHASIKLRKALISDIINGNLKTADTEELNQKYQCDLHSSVQNFITFKVDFQSTVREKMTEVIGQKLQEIIEENIKRQQVNCCIGVSGNCIHILLEGGITADIEECFYHLIYELKDYMGKLEPVHVTIGVAPVENCNLYEAAQNSLAAARDQAYRGTDKVLRYQNTKHQIETSDVINSKSAGKIRSILISVSKERMDAAIKELLEQIRILCEPVQSGTVLYHMVSAMQQQIQECCQYVYASKIINSLTEKYANQLNHCCSFCDYRDLFIDESEEIIEIVTKQQEQREKKPVREIKKIIQERYRESLDLDYLSRELELSTTYVSRLIKKELGESFSQYVNSVRLEAAKKLLSTTNDSASSIALEVGYSDEKYFHRIFKKAVGLTPNEYRRLYGE